MLLIPVTHMVELPVVVLHSDDSIVDHYLYTFV